MKKYDWNNYKKRGLMPSCLDGIKAINTGATLGETILYDKEMSYLLKSMCRKPTQLGNT